MENPLPLEALEYILYKDSLGSDWDAKTWQDQHADIRRKSFWMANIENARFADRVHGLLFDFMAQVRDEVVSPTGKKSTALRVGSREQFVAIVRDFMVEEGMADEDEFPDVNQKDVRDIRSRSRLNLIFDTQVRSAYSFGQWRQGMTPTALEKYPAAKLIRLRGVKIPRLRHQAHLGDIMHKNDPRWAEYHNAEEIGGFGVPWGPYGFNSGVDQEPVDAKTWANQPKKAKPEKVQEDAPQKPPEITDKFAAHVKTMDPDIKRRLIEELRSDKKTGITTTIIIEGDKLRLVKPNDGTTEANGD